MKPRAKPPEAAALQPLAAPDDDEILSLICLAAMLGISPRTAQRKMSEGGWIPFVKLSDRRIGFRRADVRAFLKARTYSSTSAATVDQARAA